MISGCACMAQCVTCTVYCAGLQMVLEATIIISEDAKAVFPLTDPAPKCPHLSFQLKKMLQVQDFQIQICPLFTITVLLNFFPDIYNLHTAEWD